MKRDRRGRFLTDGIHLRLDRQAAAGKPCRGGSLSLARSTQGREQCEPGSGLEEIMGETPHGWEAAAERLLEEGPGVAGVARTLTTGYCRLCHGKFSSRSLRNAFGKVPAMSERSNKQRRAENVFFADFKRLLGVAVRQDPTLSQFVCKNCLAQFYKCRSVLKTFMQKVNSSPTSGLKTKSRGSVLQSQLDSGEEPCLGDCQSIPNLQSMLSSQYCGVIRAVWGCGAGHAYVMDTDSDCSTLLMDTTLAEKWNQDKSTEANLTGNGANTDHREGVSISRMQHGHAQANVFQQSPSKETTLQTVILENQTSHSRNSFYYQPSSTVSLEEDPHPSIVQGPVSHTQPSDSAAEVSMKDETSDFSEGEDSSEDEEGEKSNAPLDELFSPCSDKHKGSNKRTENNGTKKLEEPKERKRPGPKPGWKNKLKSAREDLPPIYKCPYQGCTAVYRGADGMKKHIKEHHEQVRERPCPHPGCNKVFMIDRYLQRHVKLIHTEERNYICDQCGQTFKQRKHLSVHQMRHSGAKPLQCEICGFQCRQRASLKYHMTKHKAEAELEFACDQCGKRFEKAHNLNVHMSMVHPLTQNSDQEKTLDTERIILLGDDNETETVSSKDVKPEMTTEQNSS
ncbi:zinc finger protein 276 isoform X2 [Ambystoma mexicanum]|uniref:zinc finger protein 276 isoform X2 n=1 Tax=Ambystoma mexicanum TaxID=8296 RepID=UPI0037E76BF8